MIVTNDPQLAEVARALRNHGQDPTKSSPDFILPGFNYRMTEFQAVLGRTALRRLVEGIAVRRSLAARYNQLLADFVEAPLIPDPSDHAFQSYVVLLPRDVAGSRAELIVELADNGVEATIGTWSIPTTTYYRERYGYTDDSFPVTDEVFRRALALPMHEKLTPEDTDLVADALRAAIAHLRDAFRGET